MVLQEFKDVGEPRDEKCFHGASINFVLEFICGNTIQNTTHLAFSFSIITSFMLSNSQKESFFVEITKKKDFFSSNRLILRRPDFLFTSLLKPFRDRCDIFFVGYSNFICFLLYSSLTSP